MTHALLVLLFSALLTLQLLGGVASAHGDLQSSEPMSGDVVRRPPPRVSLVLAEPAAEGSTLEVVDGCGDVVSTDPVIDGNNFSVPIAGGRPGAWRVRMRSISAVDGHPVRASFTFRVAGDRDCSPGARPTPVESDTVSSQPPFANPDEPDPGFPVVAFAVGTVVLVGLALAVRRPWTKS